ncbi:MAG: RNA methyltransferase [Prolixibacteraceae bacterium]|nr:RNA methyltransferase [Prolixibacteraceae bacterium]
MLFVAEGEKTIHELVKAKYNFHSIFATTERLQKFENINCPLEEATTAELAKVSAFKSTPQMLAVCHQKKNEINYEEISNEISIVLDEIQDPGNLGTIIRLASWFGIKNIICSHHTADCYNPKAIQATMGAIAHVKIHYIELDRFLAHPIMQSINRYGAFLEGENIYTANLNHHSALIILGNEGKGISKTVEQLVSHKLLIPSFSNEKRVESLNVSMAAAVICSEFKRRSIPIQ